MRSPKQKKAAVSPIAGARARTPAPTSPNYEAMAELRYQIRRFLHFSEEASRAAGLEAAQYQLMLAVKGLPAGVRPRISELAERLQIKHHSTVELVNRLAARGYLQREASGKDRREVLLALTPKGEQLLQQLATHHRDELRLLGPAFITAMKRVTRKGKQASSAGKAGRRKKTSV